MARKPSLLLIIEGLTLGTSGAPMFVLASWQDFLGIPESDAEAIELGLQKSLGTDAA